MTSIFWASQKVTARGRLSGRDQKGYTVSCCMETLRTSVPSWRLPLTTVSGLPRSLAEQLASSPDEQSESFC